MSNRKFFEDRLEVGKSVSLSYKTFQEGNLVKKTKKLHPLVFIAISAIAGLVFKF